MKSMKYLMSLLVLFSFAACKTTPKLPPEKPNPGEKLLWSSQPSRPDWTAMEPELKGDKVEFVSMSDKYSTEKYARDDAEQAARKKAVQYSSTKVKEMIQNVVDQVSNASGITDPQRVQRNYEKQISEGGISQLKSKTWYLEKWQDPSGAVYWKAFLRTEIPKSVLDRALADVLRAENVKLQDQKSSAKPNNKEAIDAIMKAFEDIEKNGFKLD